MKIIGLMCVRNEDWILPCSLDAALRWCDSVVLVDHGSTDRTLEIARGFGKRVKIAPWPDPERWDEMDMRQLSLDEGRKAGGTHFAIIDADEVLTANLIPAIRSKVAALKPGELLQVPMLPMRTLVHCQDDGSVWSRAILTLAFYDRPELTWKPAGDGYHHHNRPPAGSYFLGGAAAFERSEGGVMHLQFANERRLRAKHVLYRMVDHLRWPNRETPRQLNAKYDQALEKPRHLIAAPAAWWGDYKVRDIDLFSTPWQEGEIVRLLNRYSPGAFAGLDLKGFAP